MKKIAGITFGIAAVATITIALLAHHGMRANEP